MRFSPKRIIAIDGPAGSGKSTVAKLVANRMGFLYIDTGAMYRALTLKAMEKKIDLRDEDKLVELCRKTKIALKSTEAVLRVFVDGREVTSEIRRPEVTNNVHYIASAPAVRELMVEMQRKLAIESNVVMEGRDIGTVVFPGADKKFYLDADFDIRVQRRYQELNQKVRGDDLDRKKLAGQLEARDGRDQGRKAGPLRQASDAMRIDTSGLSIKQVVDLIVKKCGGCA